MTRTIAPRGNRLLRRLAALLLVLAMILSGSVCAVSAATLPFEDVSMFSWYYSDVKNAHEQGLVDGVTPTRFSPTGTLTIAQAIKLAAALHHRRCHAEKRQPVVQHLCILCGCKWDH